MTTDLSTISPGLLKSWEFTLMRTAALLSLTKAQYKTIEDRYGTLQQILNASDEQSLAGAHIFPQGSIALKTTIRPVPNAPGEMGTVDADAIVLVAPSAAATKPAELLAALQRRFESGVRVKAPIEPLRRGVRITYADENPGFHMDVTPAIGRPNLSDDKGYGYLYVPDRETGWKNSSPRSYAQWLEKACEEEINIVREQEMIKAMAMDGLSESTQDPMPEYEQYLEHNPLRATIKLLKRHRDIWAISTDNIKIRPISAVITTLAAHSYRRVAQLSKQRPYRAIEAIFAIVTGMRDYISINTKGEYEVLNPEDGGENFAEKWNRPREGAAYREAFGRWHNQVMQDLRIGLQDHGSQANFLDSFNGAFGIPKSQIDDIIAELPRNAPLPGRNGIVTGATLALSAFTGSSSASSGSQAGIKPVDRLG